MASISSTTATLGFSMLLAGTLAALSGCDKESTQTKQTPIQSRTEPTPQAAQQPAQQQDAAARPQSAAPTSNAQTGAKPAQYLPPSADGAEVQITEKPLGGEPPATASSPPTKSGDHGGNMPTQVPSAPSPGPAGKPGVQATTGSANPQTPPATGELATPAATARARTGDEHTSALNQELQRKLAEFDALMRKAQENAAKDRADAQGGSPESRANSGQGGLLEAPPNAGAGGAAKAASGLGNTPDKSGNAAPGTYRNAGSARATPDGSDDDIVARQLREAANRETDPVLREKLWEEYRNYKGGL